MRLHLDLACVTLNSVQVQLSETQVQLSDTQVQLSDTQEELKETTRKLEKNFTESTIKLDEFKEKTIELEEKVSVLEKTVQCSDECNNYKWKISGFNEVLRKGKSGEETFIESSPFYQHGYNCKLRLYPNGFASGENTHLTVSLYIKKGEYDATLPWPFHKKVTFTLIDQHENTNDSENIVKYFTADPEKKECFARPVADGNSGRGFHYFVSHNRLRERRYIVDDTIFIQIQFDPPK